MSSAPKSTSPHVRTRGFILPFFALILIFVLLPMLALLIGNGFLLSDSSKLQSIANSAALAALEEWSRNPATTPGDRASAARRRATEIINQNSIYSSQLSAATVVPGTTLPEVGGILRFGSYFEQNNCVPGTICTPECGTQPENYPCFIERPISAPNQINAVQLRLSTSVTEFGLVYFANQFFNPHQKIVANATASTFSRCVTMLLDVSLSTTEETHNSSLDSDSLINESGDGHNPIFSRAPSESSLLHVKPNNQALFAFRDPLPTDFICRNLETTPASWSLENFIWCATRPFRSTATNPPWSNDYIYGSGPDESSNWRFPDTPVHFKEDYRRLATTARGPIWYDFRVTPTYDGPQPLTAFLDGFNSALRIMRGVRTGLDLATVKAFVGSEIPPFGILAGPVTSRLIPNIDNLIIATNADNRGVTGARTTAEVTPNFLTHGWVPLAADVPEPAIPNSGNTNIVGILDRAIQQLADPAQCPAGSQRHIILATDGLPNCWYMGRWGSPGWPTGNTPLDQSDGSTFGCSNSGPNLYNYQRAEEQLLGNHITPGVAEFQAGNGRRAILQRLLDNQISLSVILRGKAIDPNFRNIRKNPGATCSNSAGTASQSCYLSPTEAAGMGFGGLGLKGTSCGRASCDFFDDSPSCDDPGSCSNFDAYQNLGKPNFVFRRPNAVFGHMAFETGGVFCPLQDPSPTDPYNCKDSADPALVSDRLCDQNRVDGARQSDSVYQRDLSQQAASCMIDAIGYSPFSLSEPRCLWTGSGCQFTNTYQ